MHRCDEKNISASGSDERLIQYRRNVDIICKQLAKTNPSLDHWKKILKVTGPDRMALLQLVLSNDGRIMYDVLLFEDEDGKSTLVECDADVHADVIAFILKYRMRKTVDVVADNSRSVYVYYLPNQAHIREPSIRLPDGCVTLKEYIDYRYSLALGEGSKDFIPGTCFPHETNARQFKGMNFSKGCYIGQELTARIEYTGVVRKRFMPLLFHVDQLQKLCTVQYNSQVICERNRKSSTIEAAISRGRKSAERTIFHLTTFLQLNNN
ncbi:putative transferase [Trichinella spiralis]|uniref:Transferase n=1 Tax=Trichinella spiralis TaxID=6334 RepID=A0ABR3KC50_TRISP